MLLKGWSHQITEIWNDVDAFFLERQYHLVE